MNIPYPNKHLTMCWICMYAHQSYIIYLSLLTVQAGPSNYTGDGGQWYLHNRKAWTVFKKIQKSKFIIITLVAVELQMGTTVSSRVGNPTGDTFFCRRKPQRHSFYVEFPTIVSSSLSFQSLQLRRCSDAVVLSDTVKWWPWSTVEFDAPACTAVHTMHVMIVVPISGMKSRYCRRCTKNKLIIQFLQGLLF